MADLYDLMLLLDAEAPEDRRQEILAEVIEKVEGGGTLVGIHDWGSRRMAFEIDHRPDADYRLVQFEGDRALLERLDASLKIADGVIRFRIIRQRPGGPEVPPAPDPLRTPGSAEGAEPESRVAARAAADAPADEE